MSLLMQSAFLKALGWALFHSLWQMGVCWLAYVVITQNGQRLNARQRYNIGFSLTAIGTLAFFLTFLYFTWNGSNSGFLSAWQNSSLLKNYFQRSFSLADTTLPFLSFIYIVMVFIMMVRLFRMYHYTNKLFTSGIRKIDPSIRLYLEETKLVLGVKKKVGIGVSAIINTPLTIGFWKPIILLPLAAVNNLSLQQTEAIILHELNHIKQNDYLLNILIATLDILLFFNPFSRWMTKTLMKERENNCDDVVLQFKYSPRDYAEALLVLEKCRSAITPLLSLQAIGNSKKLLLQRIQRIIYGKTHVQSLNYRLLGLFVILLMAAFSGVINPTNTLSYLDSPGNYDIVANNFAVNSTTLPANNSDQTRLQSIKPKNLSTPRTLRLEPVVTMVDLLDEIVEPIADQTEDFPLISTGSVGGNSYTFNQNIASYESKGEDYSFSLVNKAKADEDLSKSPSSAPYVPYNSFSYNNYQDTTNPIHPIPNAVHLDNSENIEKVLRAIAEIDLESFEDVQTPTKENILAMQSHLRKALQELDWKRMEKTLQEKYKLAILESQIKITYLNQLAHSRVEKEKQMSTDLFNKQKLILLDHLNQNQSLQNCEEIKSKKVVKTRKIVVI